MEFAKRSLGTFGTQFLIILFGLANNVIVSHVLGAEGQGVFTFIVILPLMVVAFGNLGVSYSNVYFIGSKKHDFSTLFSNSLVLAVVWGGALTISIIIFGFLGGYRFKVDWAILQITVLAIPFSLVTLYVANTLLGLNRILDFNVIDLVPKMMLFFGLICSLYLFKTGVTGTAWAFLAAEIITALGAVLHVVTRISDYRGWIGAQIRVIAEMIRFGLKVYIGHALAMLNYRIDMFLILYFLDARALGYYSIAVLLAEKIWLIPNSISSVLLPRVSSGERTRDFTPTVCRITLLVTFSVAVVLFIVAEPLIGLIFPDDFTAAVAPLKWLLPGIVILGIPKLLAMDLIGRGRPLYSSIAMMITAPLNVILNILLIPAVGITGAAQASTVSYAAAALVLSLLYKKETGVGLFELILLRKSDFQLLRDSWRTLRARSPHNRRG